ncbi:uncharacterized protein LOC135216225 [Macrobrachium nipponense]|uniref:uncharacterized protein LOC135216225 n=1 Tax=Macrobrachium nipponense TaxID=159736 RepID=UPI0030C81EA0
MAALSYASYEPLFKILAKSQFQTAFPSPKTVESCLQTIQEFLTLQRCSANKWMSLIRTGLARAVNVIRKTPHESVSVLSCATWDRKSQSRFAVCFPGSNQTDKVIDHLFIPRVIILLICGVSAVVGFGAVIAHWTEPIQAMKMANVLPMFTAVFEKVPCLGLNSLRRHVVHISAAAGIRRLHLSDHHNDIYMIAGEDDFKNKVMRNSLPVIVNFHADWCEPCHSLKPLLQKIAEEHVGRLHLAEVMWYSIL